MPLIAILAVTGILIAALSMGFDGILLGSGLTMIAGLGGYTIGQRRGKGDK